MGTAREPKRLAKVLAFLMGRSEFVRLLRVVIVILAVVVLGALALLGYVGAITYRQTEAAAHKADLAQQAAQQARRVADAAAQREAAQRAEAEQAKLKADYEANRAKLLSEMRVAVKRGDPAGAEAIGEPYLPYADLQFTKQYNAAVAAEAEQRTREAAKEKREVMAARRRVGVSLGMTEERVLESSWGKPDHVNRTITVNGVHEQWVYESHSSGYLYFDNGILTGVQN